MPRLPDCRIVGKELTFVFPSNGDALVGYRMIREAVEAAEKAKVPAPEADFLEVGCKYYDRGGNIWTVESRTPGVTPYPYRALMTSPCGRLLAAMFCANGRYHHTCEPLYDLKYYVEFEDHYDLIKRVGAAPKNEPAPKPPLTFRVGGKYRDRTGKVQEVDKTDREGPYSIRTCGINGVFNYFTAEGQYFDKEISDRDLTEEVTPCPTIHDCRAGQTERCTCYHGEG